MKIRLEITDDGTSILRYEGAFLIDKVIRYLKGLDYPYEVRLVLMEDSGIKSIAEFEGKSWKEKAIKFLDSFRETETQDNAPLPEMDISKLADDSLTLKKRLEMFLKYEYPRVWFSSLDVKEHYEGVFGKINLSTVSTYLARMNREGILERRGNRNQREYRLRNAPDQFIGESTQDIKSP